MCLPCILLVIAKAPWSWGLARHCKCDALTRRSRVPIPLDHSSFVKKSHLSVSHGFAYRVNKMMIFTNSYVKWIWAGGRESSAREKMEKKGFDQRTKETQTSTMTKHSFRDFGGDGQASWVVIYICVWLEVISKGRWFGRTKKVSSLIKWSTPSSNECGEKNFAISHEFRTSNINK